LQYYYIGYICSTIFLSGTLLNKIPNIQKLRFALAAYGPERKIVSQIKLTLIFMQISKRALKLTSSPLYVFAKKVKEQEALGREIISLGLGEPYYDTPEIIKQAGIEAIQKDKTHYNPAQGSMALRKKIAEKYSVGVECVSVSSGAKPFLGSIFWSLVDDGDLVFAAGPYYPPFFQIAQHRLQDQF